VVQFVADHERTVHDLAPLDQRVDLERENPYVPSWAELEESSLPVLSLGHGVDYLRRVLPLAVGVLGTQTVRQVHIEFYGGLLRVEIVARAVLEFYVRELPRAPSSIRRSLLFRLPIACWPFCNSETSIAEALGLLGGPPVLILDRDSQERLVGILTPFDLL
jgi:hypothetical protein